MENFFKLHRFIDHAVGFLELSMFTNASLPNIYYLIKWIGDSSMKKTTFC